MEIQGQRATKAIYRNVFDKWVLLSSGIDREDKLDGAWIISHTLHNALL